MASEQETFSNPFGLGVFGLAIACFALAPILCGFVKTGAAGFIPWSIMFGGLAQLIAGVMDMKNKSILGGTALSLYGLLWIALGIEFILNVGKWGASPVIGGNVDLMLCIMSLFFTFAFASTNLITFLILVGIDCAFLGLAFHKLHVIPGEELVRALGVLVYVIGLMSAYAAGAFVLNSHYGRKILPMGPAVIKK